MLTLPLSVQQNFCNKYFKRDRHGFRKALYSRAYYDINCRRRPRQSTRVISSEQYEVKEFIEFSVNHLELLREKFAKKLSIEQGLAVQLDWIIDNFTRDEVLDDFHFKQKPFLPESKIPESVLVVKITCRNELLLANMAAEFNSWFKNDLKSMGLDFKILNYGSNMSQEESIYSLFISFEAPSEA